MHRPHGGVVHWAALGTHLYDKSERGIRRVRPGGAVGLPDLQAQAISVQRGEKTWEIAALDPPGRYSSFISSWTSFHSAAVHLLPRDARD